MAVRKCVRKQEIDSCSEVIFKRFAITEQMCHFGRGYVERIVTLQFEYVSGIPVCSDFSFYSLMI